VRLLWLFLAVALVAAALVLTWEGFQQPEPAPAAPAAEPPRYAVTGVEWLRLGRDGEPEFRARAATLDYFADDSVVMRDVRLDALGGYGTPWRVEAPRGSAPPRDRRLRLSGGVRATGALASEDVALSTPRLWVDLLRRELHTDARVELRSDFRSATARGLRTDFDGEHVQLLNDVRVDYVIPGG
jgi:LPS export ABC transporter protein LptC